MCRVVQLDAQWKPGKDAPDLLCTIAESHSIGVPDAACAKLAHVVQWRNVLTVMLTDSSIHLACIRHHAWDTVRPRCAEHYMERAVPTISMSLGSSESGS